MTSEAPYHNITEELNIIAAELRGKNKSKSTTTTKRSSKSRKKINENDEAMEEETKEEEACSGIKKLDHNAKERIRRMKLNASYLALRALLPDSRRSKKKWSAPAIVDRVLKYIPELEKEIEALRCNKENHVQSQPKEINHPAARANYETPTVSLNQLNQQEAIFQVCMAREEEEKGDDPRFTKLLQSVEEEEEEEGICIKSASALDISDTRICHHLHIQIQTNNSTASEAEHQFEELRDKLISWLS